MILAPLLQAIVALSGSPTGLPAARPSPTASLQEAVQRFESFDDRGAVALLRGLLRRSPPAPIAAKAHIYLGLIALNSLDLENARLEFKRAVRVDALVDLPLGLSPKAQVLFTEARREVVSAPMDAPPARVAPSSAVAAETATVEGPAPSHVPAYVVGALGVATLAAGGIFGYLQQQAGSSASNEPGLTAALNDGQAYTQDGLAADVLFCVGGAALVTAIILFATEHSEKAPEVAFSVGPGGFALSGAF